MFLRREQSVVLEKGLIQLLLIDISKRLDPAIRPLAFLEIPSSTSSFFCGLDNSAGLKGIADDKMADLSGL